MSSRTRSTVRWSLLIALLALPVEVVMLEALRIGNQDTAQAWVSRMSASEFATAVENVGALPLSYRKQILRSGTPEQQAAAWRGVIDRFVRRTPDLSTDQANAVLTARALATSASFANPTQEWRGELAQAADTVRQLLGAEVFRELFVTAGPATTTTAALPLRVRVEGYLQAKFVAHAFTDCNCHAGEDSQDCSGSTPLCSETTGCEFAYYGCGIWNMSTCNGYCMPPKP